jgi:hypothetical protein
MRFLRGYTLMYNVLIQLNAETAVPVYELREKLSFFQGSPHPMAWTGLFRGSPNRFKESDGLEIFEALQEGKTHPRVFPVDFKKLNRKARGQTFVTQTETIVTIPEEPESLKPESLEVDTTEHTKIQALLLRLGKKMSFETWVARNDKSKEFECKTLEVSLAFAACFPCSSTKRPIKLSN